MWNTKGKDLGVAYSLSALSQCVDWTRPLRILVSVSDHKEVDRDQELNSGLAFFLAVFASSDHDTGEFKGQYFIHKMFGVLL